MSDIHAQMMAHAIDLARFGDPSPNPHVGCVIARDDKIVGEGYHKSAGQDHAEIVALHEAGDLAQGATLYVTLEPCNHQGKTPPCVDAILKAGVARVVIGCRDPNPNIAGGGIERLHEAGVDVIIGVDEDEAKVLVRPWSKFVLSGLSYLSLKLAVSLDGRIASRTGVAKWITCAESRRRVHELRVAHDAVMIGISTASADDPQLTVRDVPGRDPIRVIVDSKLRLPLSSRLVTTAPEVTTCVITTIDASRSASDALEAAGVNVIRVAPTAEGRCDMQNALEELAARQVVTVLCEGGAELAGSLLAAGLVDEMHVFIAPRLLGPRGRPGAVDWAGPENPTDAPRIEDPKWELCGSDAYVSGPLVYPKRVVRPSSAS
jgi:diaminohydroxyphosphoribosylaminopyrimidine deaminase/5-amino-6-(5-phosphoribosylamino)uracil reductase